MDAGTDYELLLHKLTVYCGLPPPGDGLRGVTPALLTSITALLFPSFHPMTPGSDIQQLQAAIDFLGADVLGLDLSHISATAIARGEEFHIKSALEVLAELQAALQMMEESSSPPEFGGSPPGTIASDAQDSPAASEATFSVHQWDANSGCDSDSGSDRDSDGRDTNPYLDSPSWQHASPVSSIGAEETTDELYRHSPHRSSPHPLDELRPGHPARAGVLHEVLARTRAAQSVGEAVVAPLWAVPPAPVLFSGASQTTQRQLWEKYRKGMDTMARNVLQAPARLPADVAASHALRQRQQAHISRLADDATLAERLREQRESVAQHRRVDGWVREQKHSRAKVSGVHAQFERLKQSAKLRQVSSEELALRRLLQQTLTEYKERALELKAYTKAKEAGLVRQRLDALSSMQTYFDDQVELLASDHRANALAERRMLREHAQGVGRVQRVLRSNLDHNIQNLQTRLQQL